MDKINFQNLPGTETPINADNLNKLQDNVESAINEIDDKVKNRGVIKAGETYSYPINYFCGLIFVWVDTSYCLYTRIYAFGGSNKWAYSFNEIQNHTYEGNQNARAIFSMEEDSETSDVIFKISNTGSVDLKYQVTCMNCL